VVAGPVALQTPERVERIDVLTAAEMQQAVLGQLKETDIFIAAAAVADYRPQSVAAQKLKKSARHLTLELERNPDILATVAAQEDAPFTVGFAAETESVELNARHKLQAKSLDMIAANRVGADLGFDTDDNALQVFWEGGSAALEQTRKSRLARQLVALVAERYHHKHNGDKVIKLHAKDPA
jgi:phosphopantothenoylcysteine decarboxylase/phosphopantothenate--cysteine ligase